MYQAEHPDFSPSSSPEPVINPTAEALLDRCTTVLEEVESFQRSLRRVHLERAVEVRLFLAQLKAEHQQLQALTLESPDSASSRHNVTASNLPYLEAIWTHAKGTTGLIALCKSFTYTEPTPEGPILPGARPKNKKSSVTVDIVAENGLQWIKVSLLTPRRLMYDITKAGWEGGDTTDEEEWSGDEEGEVNGGNGVLAPRLATADTPLARLADTLVLAASQTRIQYLHPAVTISLPLLHPPTPTSQALFTTLQQKGVTILPPSPSAPLTALIESLPSPSPLPVHATPLTQTLNLDTTLLLVLASSITHSPPSIHRSGLHPHLQKQIEQETEVPLWKSALQTLFTGRDLVCAASAYARFSEIIGIVGDDSETERAKALFTEKGGLEMLQAQSIHDLSILRLPIRVIPDPGPTPPKEVTVAAWERVSKALSAVNRAAVMAGWRDGLTTVTCNRGVAKVVEKAVMYGIGEEDVMGPDLYALEIGRSLIGRARTIVEGDSMRNPVQVSDEV